MLCTSSRQGVTIYQSKTNISTIYRSSPITCRTSLISNISEIYRRIYWIFSSLYNTKEKKIGYIDRYITKILDIGRYRYDFANQRSVGQKSVKSPIFRRNIESISHARMCCNLWKNIGKYRRYIDKYQRYISKILKIYR